MKNFLRHIGRRGASLLFLGLVVLLSGISLVSKPPVFTGSLHYLLQILPLKAWGVTWIITGGLMMVGACWKRLEAVGFGLASFLMSVWATGYTATLIFGRTPDWGGPARGAVIYYGFAIWLQIIAGWPEVIREDPKDVPRP